MVNCSRSPKSHSMTAAHLRTARIIIVENDPSVARALERLLTTHSYAVRTTTHQAEFWRVFRQDPAELVLLDLNLGEEDGLDFAPKILQASSAGIIMLTGRNRMEDRLQGLHAGADDYIEKPFVPDELLARIKAVLRRRGWLPMAGNSIDCGPVRLDPMTRSLGYVPTGSKTHLTETEARILELLLREPGRGVSREILTAREKLSPQERAIDVHVAHIRRKLDQAGIRELRIQAVRGIGYRAYFT